MQLIRITHSSDPLLQDAVALYESAFPNDERTTNEQFLAMIDRCPEMSFFAISEQGGLDGMAVIWDLGICRYLLYLAVKEDKRNAGLGAETLRQLLSQSTLPIIGEVEYPESNPMAARRIGFYQRNGFHIECKDPKILNSSHHYDTCHLMLISSQPLQDIDECQRCVVDIVYKNMHAE